MSTITTFCLVQIGKENVYKNEKRLTHISNNKYYTTQTTASHILFLTQ